MQRSNTLIGTWSLLVRANAPLCRRAAARLGKALLPCQMKSVFAHFIAFLRYDPTPNSLSLASNYRLCYTFVFKSYSLF